MTADKPNQIYHFGNFRLTVRNRTAQLSQNGQTVALTPKAANILLALIENRGQILSRDELLQIVWNDCFVEENCLTKNISTLRKVLGDTNPFAPRFIETVSRRGYRFVAGVKMNGNTRRKNGRQDNVGSLAVLPFKVFDATSKADYLGIGLADVLITRLSNLRQVAIRPTSAVRKYEASAMSAADIGRELNVEWVLDGSLFQSGKQTRATVQFINVREARLLWGEKLDVESADLIGIQDALAGRITQTLIEKLNLDRVEMPPQSIVTADNAAFKEYLEGRFHWNKRTAEAVKKAAVCFKRAIEIAPKFALAHAGLGDALLLFSQYGLLTPHECFTQAKASALAALELDANLAEPHTTLAHVAFLYEWNRQTAEYHYRRAIELNPNYATAHHWYGLFLRAVKRYDEAITELNLALQIDPLSAVMLKNLGAVYATAYRFSEAEAVTRKAIELEPNFALAHRTLGWIYLQQKRYDSALNSFETAARFSPDDPAIISELAAGYAAAKRPSATARILSKLDEIACHRHVSSYDVAQIYVRLTDFDKALELLQKAYQERDSSLTLLAFDPDFDDLRDDPRFQQFIKRVNF